MTVRINSYPLWLRLWHWSNALLFLLLVVTGISLHFASPDAAFIPFKDALVFHNVGGILMSGFYLAFLVGNAVTGNGRYYLPKRDNFIRDMWKQMVFYGIGIFRGDPHPFPASRTRKFNPLQQLTYLFVMYGAMPILIITGFLFLFPEYGPDKVMGMGGIWPVAVLHYVIGFLLTVFLAGHLYLITTGETITSELQKMMTGWEDFDDG